MPAHPARSGGVGFFRGIALILCFGGCLATPIHTAAQPAEPAPTTDAPAPAATETFTAEPVPTDPATEAPPVLELPADNPATDNDTETVAEPDRAVDADTQDTAGDAWSLTSVFLVIWNAELFSAGGNPIHLNQLILAALIILIGIWVSRRIANLVQRRVARIQRVNSHAAAMVHTVVFNALVVIIILAAMPIAGIPTTIFTVLGGAVAIGIGFGAQNLFNNLISGLILMLEQPIRLGDIVQVGNEEGIVEAINNRCTNIRRSDGVDMLIPNSHFLEQPVINWTLSDRNIRGSMVVGVAYGSPTERVAQLLRQCVDEHSLIHDRPEPHVLFKDFGDNALTFEVYFWARITRPMDLKKIQSDLRFRFDALCREDAIVIAYPQRDVHLDTLSPIEIKMVSKPAEADG